MLSKQFQKSDLYIIALPSGLENHHKTKKVHFFENPSSNDLMISTNINIGLWKWFEGYLDLGILKDKDQKTRDFYGTGIKLNLLPDFFELYFPISSSNGIEIDDYRYYNKIRFVLSYNINSLINLFSRKWF